VWGHTPLPASSGVFDTDSDGDTGGEAEMPGTSLLV